MSAILLEDGDALLLESGDVLLLEEGGTTVLSVQTLLLLNEDGSTSIGFLF